METTDESFKTYLELIDENKDEAISMQELFNFVKSYNSEEVKSENNREAKESEEEYTDFGEE